MPEQATRISGERGLYFMRGMDFLYKMELIDPVYVEAADQKPLHKKHGFVKWGVIAACLCLVIVAVPFALHTPVEQKEAVTTETEGSPYFVIDNRKFLISSHLSVSDVLPEGFVKAGHLDVVGDFQNCPYYVNPDFPEWIYVYHEVRTDGTVDETGTLRTTPPHDAYVRYVDERLRGKDLICYRGKYYISMWTASTGSDHPDVTQEYFDQVNGLYGKRIEGVLPDGFVLAGATTFTGNDTLPTGALASNTSAAPVYYNPDDATVLLKETHWFTATAEEKVETQHNGYCVYMLYDCPLKEAIIHFHEKTFRKSEVSRETMEWLTWYQGLTEEEQWAVSSVPPELYQLYEQYEDVKTVEANPET